MSQNEVITSAKKVINDSADSVWARLRKLDGVEAFLHEVVGKSWIVDNQAPGVGTKRSCTLHNMSEEGHATAEEVIAFDDTNRSYSYKIEEGSMPVKNMVNTFSVKDLGYKKCELSWEATMASFIENPQMSEIDFRQFVKSNGEMLMANFSKLHNNA